MLPASFSLPREVMPTLGGAEDAEVLLPLPLAADAGDGPQPRGLQHHRQAEAGRHGRGRRRPRWTRITARLRREHPDFYPPNGGLTFGIVPLQEQVVGDVRRSLVDADRARSASCC